MFAKLATAVLGVMLVLGLASSASAYTATDPGARVDRTVVTAGATITFSATGFRPGSPVTVTVTRTAIGAGGSGNTALVVATSAVSSATVTADGSGSLSTPVTLGGSGLYTITASGVDPDGRPLSVSQTVTVPAGSGGATGSDSAAGGAGSGSAGELAFTGSNGVATLAWAAVGVLLLGAMFLLVATRRGRVTTSA